ncbi:ATP-grasp domain-containing protein [Paludifilum halophilum]|uniref:ATP-grasp domain-containing protein n=1 Tax=Paludifilum halophilum TaxID=1642702 RepID=A0A235B2Z8_9BACL|nr:ATP-grasp domain-containing protein [Paludifilum halophilum]OYD06339.1 hypothetical protein CHM34_16625 [Paludifilum halophilum]
MPNKPKRVLVIGLRKNVLEQAKALDLYVILIHKKERLKEHHRWLADEAYPLDIEDEKTLLSFVETIHQTTPVEVVLSFADEALVSAARCHERLGLKGNSVQTVEILKDKGKMRTRLRQIGFPSVRFRVGGTQEDFFSFLRSPFHPFIVKPTDGAGSDQVYQVRDETERNVVWSQLVRNGRSEFLMEEYLDGPEISVEAFSFHGNHHILAITDKVIFPNFVERGHAMPSTLSPRMKKEVVRTVTSFLDGVDFIDGPSHTELKITSKGLRILESHNRIGGDKINELYKIAYGENMLAMLFAWETSRMTPWKTPPPPVGGAAIRFLSPPPGIVQEIRGVEKVKKDPNVCLVEIKVEEGEEVPRLKHSFDRIGCVVAKGKDTDEAVQKAEEMVRSIQILTAEPSQTSKESNPG